MGVSRLKSIVSEQDFVKTAYSQISASKVSESPTITVNSWAWNTTYKAAHVNVDATKKGTFEIPLHYLKVGDVVKIKCEVMNVSGVKAKISLDKNDTHPTGSVDYSGGGSIANVQSSKIGEFEYLEFTTVMTLDAYYSAVFGLFSADVGQFYIRNCVIEIESIYQLNKNKTPYERSFKQFVFRITAGNTGVYEKNVTYGFDDAVITVDSSAKCLNIDYTEPFTYAAKNPVVMIAQSSTGNTNLYDFKIKSSSASQLRVELWEKSTGTLIDPVTVVGPIIFHVLASGYDVIG